MSSAYFKDRAAAGRLLAKQLKHYANQPCHIVALTEGAIVIAAQIAMEIHANIGLLLTEQTGETDKHNINALAVLGREHVFNYNMRPAGSIEYDEAVDGGQSKPGRRSRSAHVLLGHDGDIRRKLLHQKVVIVVSDGFNTGESLEIAAEFLESTVLKRLVVAVPVASFEALNRIHVMADEVLCQQTEEIFQGTNHYYDDNTIAPAEDLFRMVADIALTWKQH